MVGSVSRRGAEGEMRFVIGLILGIIIIIFFVKCAYTFFQGEDTSLKSFEKLSTAIKGISASADSSRIEPTLVNLKQGEVMLFFDKDVNVALKFQRDDYEFQSSSDPFEKGQFLLYDPNYVYSFFLSNADYVIVYPKPEKCGNSSCMVLCRDMTTMLKDSYSLDISASVKNMKIDKPTEIITCNPKEVILLDGVKSIYVKPFFYWPKENLYTDFLGAHNLYSDDEVLKFFESEKKTASYNLAFSFGAGLQHSFGSLPSEKDKTIKKVFLDPHKDDFRYFFSELKPSRESSELLKASTAMYVYTQKYEDGVVLCYQSPCLTDLELARTKWKNEFLDPCLKSSENCAALKDRLMSIKSANPAQEITLSEHAVGEGAAAKKYLKIVIKDVGASYPEKEVLIENPPDLILNKLGTEKNIQKDIFEVTFHAVTVGSEKSVFFTTKGDAAEEDLVFMGIASVPSAKEGERPKLLFNTI